MASQVGIATGGNVSARDIHITLQKVDEPIKLPDVYRSVPMPMSTFTGRKELLDSIHNQLQKCLNVRHFMSRMVALVGLGGMGKTETAKQLAHQYQEFYKNVVWIDAETHTSTETSFSQLAQDLGLSNTFEAGTNRLTKSVYRHVSQYFQEPMLFIFDNANQLKTRDGSFGIFDYLPAEDIGNPPLVLLTSQTADWGTCCKVIEASKFGPKESAELLRSRFKLTEEDFRTCNELENVIQKLLNKLDGYPLALGLVASNISYVPGKTSLDLLKQDLEEYIHCIEENQVLGQDMGQYLDADYPRTLVSVFENAMNRLEWQKCGQGAKRLLCILAYCPQEQLYEWMASPIYYYTCVPLGITFPAKSDSNFERALDDLQRCGLVTLLRKKSRLLRKEFHEIQMHRLVQTMAREYDTSRFGIQKLLLFYLDTGLLWSNFTQKPWEDYLWSDNSVPAWALQSEQSAILWLNGLRVFLYENGLSNGYDCKTVDFRKAFSNVANGKRVAKVAEFLARLYSVPGYEDIPALKVGISLTEHTALVMSACRPKRRWWVICKPLSDSMETQLLKITTLAAVAVHDQNELNCRELLYPSDCEQRGKLLRRLRKLHPELMTWTTSEADMPEYWIKQLVRRTYSTCSRATKVRRCFSC